jgi:proteic killer suppression protein
VFDSHSAEKRYLALLSSLASSVDAQRERIELQAAAGWRLPRPALPTVRGTIEAIGARLASCLLPELAGHWAVWVDENWRLTFKFEGEDAVLVDYQDYH